MHRSTATALPQQPVADFTDYVQIHDAHWLPDGSGFVVARQESDLDPVNLFEYSFAGGAPRQRTDFHLDGKYLRRFARSPDGRRIAFEVTDDILFGGSDLWIANRDRSGAHLLVANAGRPAWSPTGPEPAPGRRVRKDAATPRHAGVDALCGEACPLRRDSHGS